MDRTRLSRLSRVSRLDRLPALVRLDRVPGLDRLRQLDRVPGLDRLRQLDRVSGLDRLRQAGVDRWRRMDRAHRMAATGALTVACVLGVPTAAMASPGPGSNPPVVTEQAASTTAAEMAGSLGQLSVLKEPEGTSAAKAVTSGTPTTGDGTVADPETLTGSVARPAAPSDAELYPVGVTAAQQTFTPTAAQLANAKSIVDAGQAMGLPPRAWVIAVATSLQESNLRNLGHLGAANDHDSLGLFQQRPSSGWGTPAQVQDPTYAATAFYRALVTVPNWDRLPLTAAAQRVQVSAFPSAYAKHEIQAGNMIDALYGVGPFADLAAGLQY